MPLVKFADAFDALPMKQRILEFTRMRRMLIRGRIFALGAIEHGWRADSRYGKAFTFIQEVDEFLGNYQFCGATISEFRKAADLIEQNTEFASMMFQVSIRASLEKKARIWHASSTKLPFVWYGQKQATKYAGERAAERRAAAAQKKGAEAPFLKE